MSLAPELTQSHQCITIRLQFSSWPWATVMTKSSVPLLAGGGGGGGGGGGVGTREAYQNGVVHEVAADVLHLLTDVVLPVLLCQAPHLTRTLQALRLLVQVPHLVRVLLPQAHPEGMDLHDTCSSS